MLSGMRWNGAARAQQVHTSQFRQSMHTKRSKLLSPNFIFLVTYGLSVKCRNIPDESGLPTKEILNC
jgi:hypothetical protein